MKEFLESHALPINFALCLLAIVILLALITGKCFKITNGQFKIEASCPRYGKENQVN